MRPCPSIAELVGPLHSWLRTWGCPDCCVGRATFQLLSSGSDGMRHCRASERRVICARREFNYQALMGLTYLASQRRRDACWTRATLPWAVSRRSSTPANNPQLASTHWGEGFIAALAPLVLCYYLAGALYPLLQRLTPRPRVWSSFACPHPHPAVLHRRHISLLRRLINVINIMFDLLGSCQQSVY